MSDKSARSGIRLKCASPGPLTLVPIKIRLWSFVRPSRYDKPESSMFVLINRRFLRSLRPTRCFKPALVIEVPESDKNVRSGQSDKNRRSSSDTFLELKLILTAGEPGLVLSK